MKVIPDGALKTNKMLKEKNMSGPWWWKFIHRPLGLRTG